MKTLDAVIKLCNVRNYLSERQSQAESNGQFIDLGDAQRIVGNRLAVVSRLRIREQGKV